MHNGQDFIDYYSVLQVHPECDSRTLEGAYRQLAKIYHPDHPETADMDRFNLVVEAYRVLRSADRRASYDVQYSLNTGFSFASTEGRDREDTSALSDAGLHARLLHYLYRRRRESARNPGVGLYDILRRLNLAEENVDFHLWYLKRKGFIETTDDGTLAITVEGVDHVIAMSQSSVEHRLRITRIDPASAPWPEPEVAPDLG